MPRTEAAPRSQGRHWRVLLACLIAVALTLAATPLAAAQRCRANPNVSATAQYCETLPTPGGGVPADVPDDSPAPTLRDTLSPAAVQRLADAGPAGAALLDLPANAPLSAEEERLLDSAGLLAGELDASGAATSTGRATIAAFARSVSAGGPGVALLAGLGVATLAGLGFALLRLRPGR
jgi:hypothetical protein